MKIGSWRGRKHWAWFDHGHKKLLGESIREIGVLLLVFVPLDGFLSATRGTRTMIETPGLRWLNFVGKSNLEILTFAVLGVALLGVGIYIEREAELAIENAKGEQP